MPRKPVLEGGKRDEIISTAMQLFFENGYEATSVRMILDRVGGEVGMFYHYFKSKEELFQKVVDRFFLDYQKQFEKIARHCDTKEEMVMKLLSHYENSIALYHKISPNMHWTISSAMSARTLEELKPIFCELADRWRTRKNEPIDIVAGQLLYAVSATIHSESFAAMALQDRQRTLCELLDRLL